jgi:hypothetical protein
MKRYKANREDAVIQYGLTEEERLSLLNDDFAAIYKKGVPLELLFQGILLAGTHPREYMRRLHRGLEYTGRGLIASGAESPGNSGNWTKPHNCRMSTQRPWQQRPFVAWVAAVEGVFARARTG